MCLSVRYRLPLEGSHQRIVLLDPHAIPKLINRYDVDNERVFRNVFWGDVVVAAKEENNFRG